MSDIENVDDISLIELARILDSLDIVRHDCLLIFVKLRRAIDGLEDSEREGWDFGAVAPLHRVGRYLPLALPARDARRRATVPAPDRGVVPFRPATQLPLPPVAHQRHDERHAA